jgi:hypothetical protein
MVWKLYYEIPSALPPVLYCDLFKTKEEALQRAFEYYTKPSHGKLVRRIDHEAEGAINQSKIEEWCRTQAAAKQQ